MTFPSTRLTAGSPGILLLPLLLTVSSVISAQTGEDPSPPPRPAGVELARSIAGSPDLGVGELVRRLAIAHDVRIEGYEARLGELLGRLGAAPAPTTPMDQALRLQQVLHEELGLRASDDLSDPENLHPPRILARHTGYCIGLTLLHLDLCERLGWEAKAVSSPRHTFLRIGAADPVNVELTRGGAIRSDEWYRQRSGSVVEGTPLRELSMVELLGHVVNNLAYVELARGKPDAGVALARSALELDPDCVEAMINLGVGCARAGRLEEALTAFTQAQAHWPGDAEVRLNRANALLGLGRGSSGIAELCAAVRLPSANEAVLRAIASIRDRLDPVRRWSDRQALTDALLGAKIIRRGSSAGLVGTYHAGIDLADPRLVRVDPRIEFHWKRGAPATGLPTDRFSVSWRGILRIPERALWSWMVICSDGVRLRIDGRLVIDAWRTTGDNFPSADIPLEAGLHEIEIDYYEAIDSAGIAVMLYSDRREEPYDLAPLLLHLAEPIPETAPPTGRGERQ